VTGWFKRLFGSVDAVSEARKRAEVETAEPAQPAPAAVESLTMPTAKMESDQLVVRMPLPNVDHDSVGIEHEDGKLRVRASGGTPQNRVEVNEVLDLKGPLDLDAATTEFEGDVLVVRVPKRS
jgi:HSP20 family molecular chaperone IbpA